MALAWHLGYLGTRSGLNLLLLCICLVLFLRSETDEKAFIGMAVAKIQCVHYGWVFAHAFECDLFHAQHNEAREVAWWERYVVVVLTLAVLGTACAAIGRHNLA